MRTRKMALVIFGLMSVVFLVLFGIIAEPVEKPASTVKSVPTEKPVSTTKPALKKPTTCVFTREPEETWPDETAVDPPIGNNVGFIL